MLPVEIDAEIVRLSALAANLARQKETYLMEHRLEMFQPNPKQYDFFVQADKRRRACFAGNRFGKSTLGVVEDCSWLLGERPFFPVGHPLRRLGIPDHGVKLMVIAEDWDKVREIFTEDASGDRLGKFFYYLPKSKVTNIKRTQTGVICQMTVTNEIDGRKRESLLVFETVKSFKNNSASMESGDYDAIHGDEPFPEEMWKALSRGLVDRNGAAWFLMTPLKFPWIYEQAVEGAVNDPDVWWWFDATMDDNPLLGEEAKRLYLEQLSPEERECRQNGKPLAYGRLVYNKFDKKRHVWDLATRGLPAGWQQGPFGPVPPVSYLCGFSLDPHPQTPHAVLFTALAPTGQVFFFDEIFEKSSIRELATKIKNRLIGCRVGWSLCDPIAWNEDPETGKCWADYMMDVGLEVMQASKQKTVGIIQTNDTFGSDRPIFVFSSLKVFQKEISKYFYDKDDKPVDKDDHIMEALYRTVIHDDLKWYPISDTSKPIVVVDEFKNISNDLKYMEHLTV